MRQAHTIFAEKISLPVQIKQTVLAFGAQTKNTLCFAKGRSAVFSRVHADLNCLEDFLSFEKDVKYFLKEKPKVFAADLHPEYQSTKYAQELPSATDNLKLIQHHHAHIASCMAEHVLKNQQVIGVAFDGTGLGNDNTLWGAEFMICDYKDFQRRAHLKAVPLIGAEKAIQEPWRIALAWLYQGYGEKAFQLKLKFLQRLNSKELRLFKKMQAAQFNAPLASSMGRLFDAVGAIILGEGKVAQEVQLAIGLENLAKKCTLAERKSYDFEIDQKSSPYIIDPLPMFKQIVKALKEQEAGEKIAFRFHFTVAKMVKQTCIILKKKSGIKQVVLSGGVFQNKLLFGLTKELLRRDFQVFAPEKLPASDAAISLGQAMIACFRSKKCV